MNSYQKLQGLRARHDDSKSVRDFGEFLLAKAGEQRLDLKRPVLSTNEAVVAELKSAIAASAATSLSSPFSLALSRLIATNSPRSAFNVMKSSMIEVPLRTRIIVSAATIEGSEVPSGGPKLFRSISLSELDTETAKFAAAVAMSEEFIDVAPALAGRVFSDLLAQAVARSADSYFIGKLNAVESDDAVSSVTDPSFAAMLSDLAELLKRVKTGEASRLFFIMRPATLKWLSAQAFASGITTVNYNGGQIMGVQLIGSDSQSPSTVTLVDASGVVFGDDGVEVRSSSVCAVQLDDAPTNTSGSVVAATSLVSCFQCNTRCAIAEERIAVRVGDVRGVANLTNANWGAGDDSPTFA